MKTRKVLLKVKLKFWELMVWLDNNMNHPIWGKQIEKNNKESFFHNLSFNFCRWSNVGWCECLDKIEEKESR